MISSMLINLFSSGVYEKIKDYIDDKSLQKFKDSLNQEIVNFINKHDGSILTSSEFNTYIEYHNVIRKIIEYILQPDTSEVPKKVLINNMNNNIIIYCQDNGYKLKFWDKWLVTKFIKLIYSKIEDYSKNKIRREDKYLLYSITQTKVSIEYKLDEILEKSTKKNIELKEEIIREIEKVFVSYNVLDKLDDKWFQEQNIIAIKNLGDRYLPELNVNLEISNVFDIIARNKNFELKLTAFFHEALIALNNLKEEEIAKCTEKLEEIVYTIPFNKIGEFDFSLIINLLESIYSILDDLEKLYREDAKINDFKLYNINQAYYKVNDLMKYIQQDEIELFNNPMLVIQGDGGVGKSHLIADIVNTRAKENIKSMLLLGQQFNAFDEPLSQIVKLLGLGNVFADMLLEKLNMEGKKQNTRLLIFIDAINEGGGKELWPNYLSGIIEKIKKYSYLGLVLTIRTTYFDRIIGENKNIKDSLVKINHYGFKEVEYTAMKKYFEYYNINQPSVPFMNPEFSNPLFLLLFCKGSKSNKENDIEISLSKIFKNYINKININLAKKYDYYEHINFVKSIFEEIVEYRVSQNYLSNLLKLDKVIELIIKTQQKYNINGNIVEGLISEGILTKNVYNDEDYIFITYDKLEDHMIASYILDKYSKEDIKEKIMKKELRISQGIAEALAIEAPEKIDTEIYELFNEKADIYNILHAFINSLNWRSEDSIKEKIIDYVNNHVYENDYAYEEFWEKIILLSVRPRHFFSAKHIFNNLIELKMPYRDEEFIPLFNKIYNNDGSSINRLIEWAMLDDDKKYVSDDVKECTAIMLTWFLCSSNRKLRDCSTKAIINILQNCMGILINLLNLFKDIDDPYIKERLYAIAYGCAVKETDIDKLRELSMFVYDNIFNKEEVYPHILLRNYARNIIEYAIYNGIELNIDIKKIKPPYSSTFPKIPEDSEIKKYRYDYKSKEFEDYYWSQNSILDSMQVEYSRDGKSFVSGDFGKYVFQSHFSYWKQLNPIDLKNIAIKRIFDLGYDVELHGNYDRDVKKYSYNRNFNQNERIGKKYQWIALYELAAQVSDNYKMVAPWSQFREEELIDCPGSYEPNIRDIDPTVIIKNGRANHDIHIKLDEIYNNFYKDNKSWLEDYSDLPDIKYLINLNTDLGQWLLLDGLYDWTEPTVLGKKKYEYPQKKLWIMIKCYIVKSKDFNNIIEQLQKVNFMGGWMPECTYQYSLYNKEYYCSSSYDFFKRDYYGGQKWNKISERGGYDIDGEVMVPTEKYTRESNKDCSSDDKNSWYKPCEEIFKNMKLRYGNENSSLYDVNNNLICFDTSEIYDKDLGFLIKKEDFLRFINLNGYRIFWTVLGEKEILGNSDIEYNRHTFSGVYYINDSKIEGKLNMFNY